MRTRYQIGWSRYQRGWSHYQRGWSHYQIRWSHYQREWSHYQRERMVTLPERMVEWYAGKSISQRWTYGCKESHLHYGGPDSGNNVRANQRVDEGRGRIYIYMCTLISESLLA